MPLCEDQEGYEISQQSYEQRVANRRKFNLDLNSTYICYSFDQSSYIDRKNPLDALRAFQMAFPPYPSNLVNNKVRLIIKTFQNKSPSWEWQLLKEMSKFDRRAVRDNFFGAGAPEFCKGELYYPVPYKLIPVNPLEYPHWPGQFWAKPDISSSAKILRKVVDKRLRGGLPNKEISKKYQRYFSAKKCGDKYIKRLRDLRLIN